MITVRISIRVATTQQIGEVISKTILLTRDIYRALQIFVIDIVEEDWVGRGRKLQMESVNILWISHLVLHACNEPNWNLLDHIDWNQGRIELAVVRQVSSEVVAVLLESFESGNLTHVNQLLRRHFVVVVTDRSRVGATQRRRGLILQLPLFLNKATDTKLVCSESCAEWQLILQPGGATHREDVLDIH